MRPRRILINGMHVVLPVAVTLAFALVPSAAFAQTVPVFADVGEFSGTAGGVDGAHGAAWGDYDNDGWLDLYVACDEYPSRELPYSPDKLYRNERDGTFVDVSETAGLRIGFPERSMGAAWGDYDNDGDLDLYVPVENGTNKLYRNEGDGTFTDVGPASGTGRAEADYGGVWGDYDNDGKLDLYVAHHATFDGTSKLFRNLGNGIFADATAAAGTAAQHIVGASWGDYDNDGKLDLVVLGLGTNGTNELYRNQGNKTFANTSASSGVECANCNSRSAAWGDYDNDGDLDLHITSDYGPSRLYQNQGNGTFTDVSFASGTLIPEGRSSSAAWGDCDNDGDLDLYATDRYGPCRLYLNNGDGTFTDVAEASGTDVPGSESRHGVVWGDYDNDGDLDLYVTDAYGPSRLYRNDTPSGGHWLHVNLVGTASNRSAIGARVRLRAAGITQTQEISGGMGQSSQNSLTAEFGLGAATSIEELVIYWPSGLVQAISPPPALDQVVTVREPWSLVDNLNQPTSGSLSGEMWAAPFQTDGHYYSLKSVTIPIEMVLPPPGPPGGTRETAGELFGISARIYADDGTGKPGTLVINLNGTAEFGFWHNVFSAEEVVALAPNSRYFVCLVNSGGGADAQWYLTGSPTHEGSGEMPGGAYRSADGGATWSAASGGLYPQFRVTVSDPPLMVFIEDAQVPEGDSGPTPLEFTVSLSRPAGSWISADYATADGTATISDNDYTPAAGTLEFAPGETTKQVPVQIVGDTREEPDELFSLSLFNPQGAILRPGGAVATGTILNDDGMKPDLRVEELEYDREGGRLTAVVHNVGKRLAGATQVLFQDRSPALGGGVGATIASIDVDPLEATETQRVSASWSHGLGEQIIAAIVDPGTRIDELSELNNVTVRNLGTMGHRPRVDGVSVRYGDKFSDGAFGNYISEIEGAEEWFTAEISDVDGDVTAVRFTFETANGETEEVWDRNGSDGWAVAFDVGKIQMPATGNYRPFKVQAFDAWGLESEELRKSISMLEQPWWMKELTIAGGCDSTEAGASGGVLGVRFSSGYTIVTLQISKGTGSAFCEPAAYGNLPREVPLVGGKETKVTHKVILELQVPMTPQLPWKGSGEYVYEKIVMGEKLQGGGTIGAKIGLQFAPDGSVDSLVIKFKAGYGKALKTMEFPFGGIFYASVNASVALNLDVFMAFTESWEHWYARPSLTLGLTGNIAAGVNLRVAKGYLLLSPSIWATYGVEFGDQIDKKQFVGGCAKMDAKVIATVGCRWFSWSYVFWRDTYGPWDLGGDGCYGVSAGDGGFATQALTQESDSVYAPALFPFPSASTSPSGRVGVVWVSSVGSDPENSDPEVFYVEQDSEGNWLAPTRITEDELFQSLAALAYLPDGRPVAVWVQNSLSRSQAGPDMTFSQVLDRQDLWYAIRGADGVWEPAAPVVRDTVPPYRADGLPSLAATDNGAVLLWARSAEDTAMAPGSSRIYFSQYGPDAWSEPAALSVEPVDDSSPAVCGAGGDSALAVWIRAYPGVDAWESLHWSLWDGSAWGTPTALRDGTWRKQSPSLARTRDGRAFATWVELEPVPPDPMLPDTVVADTIYVHHLLAATFDPQTTAWSAAEEVFADSHFVESPVALVDQRNIAVVTWRGYNGPDGDQFVALRRLDEAGAAWTLPRAMAPDTLTDWMTSAALDGSNNLYAIDMKSDLDNGAPPPAAANFVHGLSLTAHGIGSNLDLTDPIPGLSGMTPRPLTYDLYLAENAISVDVENHSVGEEVTVIAIVKNIGDVISPETMVRFYAGAPDSGGVLLPGGEVLLPEITPDDSMAVSNGWVVAAGPHRIYAVAYPDPDVPEQSGKNNRAFADVNIQAELALDSLWIADTNPVPGAEDTVLARVRNLGGTRAQGFALQFGGHVQAFEPLADLGVAAHAETTVTSTFVVSGGVDTLYAIVDPESAFADPNREDNRAEVELRVLPDLGVSPDSIIYEASEGQILASVANLGQVAASPFMVRFYSGNPMGDGVVLDSVTVAELPGASSARVGIPWPAPAGLSTIYVVADALRTVEERDEFNNETYQDLIVSGVPNLRVVEGSLRFEGQPGSLGTLMAMIKNTGNIQAFAVPVEFFSGDPDEGEGLLKEQLISTLAAGDSAVVSAPWTAPEEGATTLSIVVDRAGTIAESDETDNRASLVIDFSTPVIIAPEEVIAEATGPDGAVVHFEVTAESPRCGPVPVICTPPSGSIFPLGETTVLCEAECEGAVSSATLIVRVVDTTEPELICPTPITIECTAMGGTPASDPQLVDFFAGALATDLVDPAPEVTYQAPGAFGLGETMVRFTATDFSGNASTCLTRVTVVDTSPPAIEVTLNRYVLWPANHWLTDIVASVTISDTCDANPTFTLVSVTSDEPENGTGDGDTAPDIVGAALGSSDLSFQLRSERAAQGDGRTYTITYAATDAFGNDTLSSVLVRVPRSRAGGAASSHGFQPDGTGLDSLATSFALVVYSTPVNVEEGFVDLMEIDGVGDEIQMVEPDQRKPGLDAGRVEVRYAYVGNTEGVIVPESSYLQDLNDDGLKDLALLYSAAKLRELIRESSADAGPIGLHYTTDDGVDYAVANIFALGQPVAFSTATDTPDRGGDRRPGWVRPQDTDGTDAEGLETDAPPTITALTAIYPNPFSGTVTAAFDLSRDQTVLLAVYDVRGTLVRTLVREERLAGRYQESWDGRSEAGSRVPAGLYFVRFDAGDVRQTHKVILMR